MFIKIRMFRIRRSILQVRRLRAAPNCTVDLGLATTIAQFKTPMLRDLEDSAPYFHNGSKLHFTDVVQFYVSGSTLARGRACCEMLRRNFKACR